MTVRESTRADWIEFRYEDTVADLEAQARRLLGFLELPWEESVLQFHRHAQDKLVRSPTYEAVTKPVHNKAVGRWRNYENTWSRCFWNSICICASLDTIEDKKG